MAEYYLPSKYHHLCRYGDKIATESEITKIDESVKIEVNEIVEFAKNSPEPAESELLTEIYK